MSFDMRHVSPIVARVRIHPRVPADSVVYRFMRLLKERLSRAVKRTRVRELSLRT